MTLMSVIVAFLFAISLWYLSSNHKVTFVKLKATYLKFLPNRSWHRLTPAGGTFVSATGGTFDSGMPGTFESDTGGTFNPLLSVKNNSYVFLQDQQSRAILRDIAMDLYFHKGVGATQIIQLPPEKPLLSNLRGGLFFIGGTLLTWFWPVLW